MSDKRHGIYELRLNLDDIHFQGEDRPAAVAGILRAEAERLERFNTADGDWVFNKTLVADYGGTVGRAEAIDD